MDIHHFTCVVGKDGIIDLKVPVSTGDTEVEVVILVGPVTPPPSIEPPKPKQKTSQNRPQAGKPWSPEEERVVETLYNEGHNRYLIAQRLGRSPFAILMRLQKLSQEERIKLRPEDFHTNK